MFNRLAIRRDLRAAAAKLAPDRGLRTHKEVIVRPHISLAINRDAAQRVHPAAGIDQRNGPRTRREAEIMKGTSRQCFPAETG